MFIQEYNASSHSRLAKSLRHDSAHDQALSLARQGELDRASEMLQHLHAANPHDPAILYDHALCLSEMGRRAESIPLFVHLLDLSTDHGNGRVALGVALAGT